MDAGASFHLTLSLHQAEAVGRALLGGQEEAAETTGQEERLGHSLPFLCVIYYQYEGARKTLLMQHMTS